MRIHHLNCGTMAPLGKRFTEGTGMPWHKGRFICHCLLIETENKLVLVDTGLGLHDIATPRARLGLTFQAVLMPVLAEQETAVRQVQALGFDPSDVSDIVLTHLDPDHAGGVDDFPNARVHVHAAEADVARSPASFKDRLRFRGRVELMEQRGDLWTEYSAQGDSWFGFEAARQLKGLPEQILTIPLSGHTRGHVGVVIDTGRTDQPRWLLHAGDTYFHHDEMKAAPHCPPMLQLFQYLLEDDADIRHHNVQRLRELNARDDVQLINGHNPYYFDQAHTAPASRRGTGRP